MNDAKARQVKEALSAAYPDAEKIDVSPDPDGALIVISGVGAGGNSEAGHDVMRMSIGNGDSPVLRQILTGWPG